MSGVRRNGKAYDSADVVLTMLGTVESEVQNITYTTSQEHQVNHSLAAEGTSWSMGKITREATITLYLNSVRKLEKLAGGDLLKLAPFDINVSFVNEFNELINDTIVCKFMSQGRTVNGEMGLAQEFQLFVLDIQYNNAA